MNLDFCSDFLCQRDAAGWMPLLHAAASTRLQSADGDTGINRSDDGAYSAAEGGGISAEGAESVLVALLRHGLPPDLLAPAWRDWEGNTAAHVAAAAGSDRCGGEGRCSPTEHASDQSFALFTHVTQPTTTKNNNNNNNNNDNVHLHRADTRTPRYLAEMHRALLFF